MIKSVLVSAVASCIVSYIVSYFTAKRSFDAIDSYVKEVTDSLQDALKKLTDFHQQNK